MKRVLAIWLLLIGLVVSLGQLAAQPTLLLTGAGKGAPGGGGGGPVVTLDQSAAAHSNPGVTTWPFVSMTITGGLTDPGLVVMVAQCDGGSLMTSMALVWDPVGANQPMAQIMPSPAQNSTAQVWMFGLRNPVSGNKGLLTSWTNSGQVSVRMSSFSNVNQTSDAAAFKNFNSANGLTPAAVNISSAANHQVIAGFTSGANFSSTSDPTNEIIDNSCNTWAVASTITAGSGSVTMSGSPGGASSIAAGMDISN